MKKYIYTLIMVLSLSTTFAFADDKIVENSDWAETLTYTPTSPDRLPDNVQDILALGFPCFVVNSVECKLINNNKAIYKVVFSDPENMELTIYITNTGVILD